MNFCANRFFFTSTYAAIKESAKKRKKLFDYRFFSKSNATKNLRRRFEGDWRHRLSREPRSRPGELDVSPPFYKGGENPGRDWLIGKLIEKEYIRNTTTVTDMCLERKEKGKKILESASKRISYTSSDPSSIFFETRSIDRSIDRRRSVLEDRMEEEERSDIEVDAHSRNWQTRSYRWMKTPPDSRRMRETRRVFNVVPASLFPKKCSHDSRTRFSPITVYSLPIW